MRNLLRSLIAFTLLLGSFCLKAETFSECLKHNYKPGEFVFVINPKSFTSPNQVFKLINELNKFLVIKKISRYEMTTEKFHQITTKSSHKLSDLIDESGSINSKLVDPIEAKIKKVLPKYQAIIRTECSEFPTGSGGRVGG